VTDSPRAGRICQHPPVGLLARYTPASRSTYISPTHLQLQRGTDVPIHSPFTSPLLRAHSQPCCRSVLARYRYSTARQQKHHALAASDTGRASANQTNQQKVVFPRRSVTTPPPLKPQAPKAFHPLLLSLLPHGAELHFDSLLSPSANHSNTSRRGEIVPSLTPPFPPFSLSSPLES
jgi:hypothetical protein